MTILRLFFFVVEILVADECENSQENGERCYGSVMMERLTGSVDGRVDHVLQVRTFRLLS